MGLAHELTERLPDTFAALQSGRIDLAKARALAEVTRPLPVDKARTVEEKVLPKAEGRLLAQVRASARYHLGRVDPDGVEERRQQAKADRRAWFDLHDDGAGELCLSGPAERLYQAWILIDTLARRIRAAGDDRTLDAIRHDLTLDLILGKSNQRIKVHVYLHLPAPTAMGTSNDPGILAGYGPVTAQAARELATQDATWKRIFYDPITSVIKDLDRRTYRPPASLAEYVRVRDHTCVGPGCSKPAQNCQIDHTLAWAEGGCTCADNLDPLCMRCHRLKHLCGWFLFQSHPGKFLWKSPVGQIHEHLPEPILDHQPMAA